MPANQTRGTPGQLLLVFSCILLLIMAAAWRHPAPVAEDLSGIGDELHYTALTDNDFFKPALAFSSAPHGLFRRTVNPVHRDDAKMRRAEMEKSGRFIVYTDARPKPGSDGEIHPRWYLKASDHHYVEFGERKYFETFAPAKK